MRNLLLLFINLQKVFIIIFFTKYLQYESKTFRTFIKDEDLNLKKQPKAINNNAISNQKQNPDKRYIFKKCLGKGGFGEVSLYYDNKEKREVVIKKINKSGIDELQFYREIRAMRKLKCPYIVEYYDDDDDNTFYYIVMEKCDDDLDKLLTKSKNGFSDIEIKNILLQLNEAFKMMLSKNIIHRDLKPQNILIKYNSPNTFTVKLADFGLSRKYNNQNFSTLAGTNIFMAPELMYQEGNYDPTKCDLWAIGVIIYQLKFKSLCNFYLGTIPNRFNNKQLDDLVRKLIVVDPNKRISWNDYFNHPFFKNQF